MHAQTIRSKVVGVTFENSDGSARQGLIRKYCRRGMPLEIRPEPDNAADENALGVWMQTAGLFASRSVQLGHIRAELAEQLQESLREGCTISAQVLEVTGGGRGKNYGVNIELRVEGNRRSHSAARLLLSGFAEIVYGLADIAIALLGLILRLGAVAIGTVKNLPSKFAVLPPSRRIALAGCYTSIAGAVFWVMCYVFSLQWHTFGLLRPTGLVTLTIGLGIWCLGTIYSWSERRNEGS